MAIFEQTVSALSRTLQNLDRIIGLAFYFHATTAYAILRRNGVAIGKQEFLGGAR